MKDESLEGSANLAGLIQHARLPWTHSISVPPAVKLAAAKHTQPALEPGVVLALEITEDLEAALGQLLRLPLI